VAAALVLAASWGALAALAGAGPRAPAPAAAPAVRASAAAPPIGPLHTVTLVTRDVVAALRFYRDAMGLRARGPLVVPEATRRRERQLWAIPPEIGWDLYLLDRPSVPGTAQVRLLGLDRETTPVRDGWDPRQLGPFTLGFPTLDAAAWDRALRDGGFRSLSGLEQSAIPRPDGSRYRIEEVIFNAPDFVQAVVIARLDGMPPLGPINPASGRGGPVYSAQIVERSDEVLRFYTELGFELRADREWTSAGSRGALGVPDGTRFRFTMLYAPGASSGHLLFLDYRNLTPRPAAAQPRPPSRGLVMWSFPVRDLRALSARLRAGAAPIVGEANAFTSPELGRHRALTVLAPNGFLVELFEPEP
jgi:catechol 2,3-dioxygenase-like lactoylglutathione lyase family enzyme